LKYSDDQNADETVSSIQTEENTQKAESGNNQSDDHQ
jgi:hypothetical protein